MVSSKLIEDGPCDLQFEITDGIDSCGLVFTVIEATVNTGGRKPNAYEWII